jgi:hypothetical protein
MASGATVSPVREILESRLTSLLPDLESALKAHFATEMERVSWQVRIASSVELADQLNQAARRIHQAANAGEICGTLVEAAARFAAGVALVRIEGPLARGECVHLPVDRGISDEATANFRSVEIPLERAPALAEALRTLDPVTAAATPGEISAALAGVVASGASNRIFLCPLVVGGRAPAVLCAWGEVQGSAIELLSQIAGAALRALPSAGGLMHLAGHAQLAAFPPAATSIITAEAPKSAPALASTWDALSQEEQQIHLRAQRAARVAVAEMRLYDGEGVQNGRERRDLYAAFGPRIDAAREFFRKLYFSATPTMVDYLHLELLRTLAHDDPDVLGKDYPGPLA